MRTLLTFLSTTLATSSWWAIYCPSTPDGEPGSKLMALSVPALLFSFVSAVLVVDAILTNWKE